MRYRLCACGRAFAAYKHVTCTRCQRKSQVNGTRRVRGDISPAEIERRYQAAIREIRRAQ